MDFVIRKIMTVLSAIHNDTILRPPGGPTDELRTNEVRNADNAIKDIIAIQRSINLPLLLRIHFIGALLSLQISTLPSAEIEL